MKYLYCKNDDDECASLVIVVVAVRPFVYYKNSNVSLYWFCGYISLRLLSDIAICRYDHSLGFFFSSLSLFVFAATLRHIYFARDMDKYEWIRTRK